MESGRSSLAIKHRRDQLKETQISRYLFWATEKAGGEAVERTLQETRQVASDKA